MVIQPKFYIVFIVGLISSDILLGGFVLSWSYHAKFTSANFQPVPHSQGNMDEDKKTWQWTKEFLQMIGPESLGRGMEGAKDGKLLAMIQAYPST